ncbi:MAG: hypothetical protein IT223_02750 [Crocinitomicaceae bacterium]|nr:hypothetical protein [Crocinitomicaceae bacterium]
MVWTLIPGISMSFIIVYGLITWNKMTSPAAADALRIEVYSKQFDWTVRYPGDNNVFGTADFNMISSDKTLGLVTPERITLQIDTIDGEIAAIKQKLSEGTELLPESWVESMEDKIYRLQRHKQRILDLKEFKAGDNLSTWEAGADDRIVKGEFHIPVNREIEFVFRSQDVIHSAYMPHFRTQMNTVPGVPTRFKMTPTITTKEMREKLGDDSFDYLMLCNKVCGVAHFNMQIKIVVDDEANYNAWLKKQKTFVAQIEEDEPKGAVVPSGNSTVIALADGRSM